MIISVCLYVCLSVHGICQKVIGRLEENYSMWKGKPWAKDVIICWD